MERIRRKSAAIKPKQYSNDEIQAIVNLLELPEVQAGKVVWTRPANYWIPLIAMYSGMRRSEICQLFKSNVVEMDGIQCFRISDEEQGQSLKSKASRRFVPIHSKLNELGFLRYVEESQSGNLFPELKCRMGSFGGPFSFPEGMESDVHLANRVGCLDCHDNTRDNKSLGHGTVKRQATCNKCHARVVKSHAASIHNKLTCEACHIRNVAGYQATFWGPGKLAGADTPFYKYNGYYGVMKEPILIKDQKGRWIPVKPYPMAVMNQKKADFKPGLHWRYPAGIPDLERTDDAWGYVGLFDNLPENNKALLWIQMDKLSHKYGKSRSCDSCHESGKGEQRQDVRWEFSDQGAFPFNGSHTVIAGKEGLLIKDMKAEEQIEVSEGYRLSSFAPWVFLKDSWSIIGDFSLPEIKNRKSYETQKSDPAKAKGKGIVHGF